VSSSPNEVIEFFIVPNPSGAHGSIAVKAQGYKPEGHGFDS
jgi:hypothetical protein